MGKLQVQVGLSLQTRLCDPLRQSAREIPYSASWHICVPQLRNGVQQKTWESELRCMAEPMVLGEGLPSLDYMHATPARAHIETQPRAQMLHLNTGTGTVKQPI